MNINLSEIETIRDTKDGVRGYCPSCGCDDAYFSTAKAVWYCFQCRTSGRVLTDGKINATYTPEPPKNIPAIRDLYHRLTEKYHNALTVSALNYLHDRGITDETIEKFQLGFCPSTLVLPEYSEPIAEEAGIIVNSFVMLSGRVVFPYWYRGEVTDLRGRDLLGTSDTKYMSPKGSNDSRGAVYMFNHDIMDTDDHIIITEGEIKTLAAVQHKFPVVGWRGVSSFHTSWLAPLQQKAQVIMCFDSEEPKVGLLPPAYYTIKKLSRFIPNLLVAQLYREAEETKADIDSVIAFRGVESFKDSLDSAIPAVTYLDLMIRRRIT